MVDSNNTDDEKTERSVSGSLDRQGLLEKSKAELVELLLDAQTANQNSLEDERQRQLRRLEDAIESITDAFVLYDADGNLVMANSKFKDYYAFNAPLMVPGTPFETLFRNEIKEGLHPGVSVDDDAFIAKRVADFLGGQETSLRSHAGERWMLVTDRLTPSGDIVGLRTDITELKHREAEAIAAEKIARLAQQEAEDARHVAERRARLDALTGLYNRRGFFEHANMLHGQARRYNHPYAVAMIDIDHFKSVNDTWGHKTGDVVLEAVSRVISETLRETDIVGRIGGEEFAVLLPETLMDEGAQLADRVRQTVQNTAIQAPTNTINVTISIGIAALDPASHPLEDIIAHADTALYQAKNAGRNMVERHKG